MSDFTFTCTVDPRDSLDLVPHTDGDLTLAIYDHVDDIDHAIVISHNGIAELISALQIIYEKGMN